MKKALIITAALLMMSGCSGTTALIPVDSTVYVSKSESEVEIAIIKAAASRRWSAQKMRSGLIEARRIQGKYEVIVEITYSDSDYIIYHKRSTNMKASSEAIHKNYYDWVNDLDLAIQRELVK